MVHITLTNHHENTAYPYQSIIFDTATHLFKLEDDCHITQNQLLDKNNFSHPLLDEPYTPTPDSKFKYDYNSLTEAMYITTFICAALINTSNSDACQFEIQPSPTFQKNKLPENIHLSINKNQASKQTIALEQFNDLISQLYKKNFQYSNDLIINDTVTLENLPDAINGDALYTPPRPEILQLFNASHVHDTYELRYIDVIMGFGVFSRVNIKQGDFIGIYCGTQTHVKEKNLHYSFSFTNNIKKKPSKTYIHALLSGNITRFVNHAPDKTNKSHRLLSANLKATQHQLQGLTCIAFQATENISPGEQLLIDYGQIYFNKNKVFRFKRNNKPIYGLSFNPFSNSKRNLIALKAMASHNIQAAKHYFLKRLLIITACISITATVFNFI